MKGSNRASHVHHPWEMPCLNAWPDKPRQLRVSLPSTKAKPKNIELLDINNTNVHLPYPGFLPAFHQSASHADKALSPLAFPPSSTIHHPPSTLYHSISSHIIFRPSRVLHTRPIRILGSPQSNKTCQYLYNRQHDQLSCSHGLCPLLLMDWSTNRFQRHQSALGW